MAGVDEDIAVVGIGCRFPGADNLDEYWKILVNGENHIKDIPNDRWEVDDFHDEDQSKPGKSFVKKAALAKDTNQWDHKFYGINEMEAEFVDPQHRMALDCVHMALEDAGIRRKDISGSNTAVYLGSMNRDFQNSVLMDKDSINNYTAVGLHNSILSARVAFVYNLHGPAITMDTACSSSLVAIHLGAQALKLGDCDTVICGGVNSITDPTMFIFLSKAKMVSPTGESLPFSAAANGYARGEGCGIVLLKRLNDAIRDGNKIWGLLKTGSNQDGRTVTPITAPSGSQQTELLEKIYTTHGVNTDDIQVIEAHGTGTPVGDPVENNALGRFFSKNKTKDRKVYIGTVKSNIGHTEAAAGTAGLIKILLMMQNGKIVPSLLDKANINPKINFDQYGFEVPSDVINWQRPASGRRVACVNSFGFGGTNAHVVVHEHITKSQLKKITSSRTMDQLPTIVALSAQDKESLIEQVEHLSTHLKRDMFDMEALSYTSLCKRDHKNVRKAFSAESQDQLLALCEAYIQSPPDNTLTNNTGKMKIGFVFCGVGTTWEGMCSFMMQLEVFRNAIEQIDSLLFHLTGWTIASKLSNATNDILSDPLVGHIVIFACQVGLVEVWKQFGVKPDVIIGQSVGEVAAAYTSGAIDLDSAVKVIYYRSKFLSEVTGGAMAVVKNVDTNKVEDICQSTDGKLSIAVYNSPVSCTISGDKAAIELVRQKLTNGLGADGGVLIDLDVKCAYHSPYVQEAAEKATHFLKDLKTQTSFTPIVSTVTGKEELPDIFTESSYWKDNTQQPVQFMKAVRSALPKDKNIVFLEIGPGPVLGAHISKIFKNESIPRVLPTMRRKNEIGTFNATLCAMFEMGFNPSWDAVIGTKIPITIPKYVFKETEIKYKAPKLSLKTQTHSGKNKMHLYIKDQPIISHDCIFKVDVDEESTPFIFDHIVKGVVLVPGAIYADVGFKIGEEILNLQPHETSVSLEFAKPAKIQHGSKSQLSVSTFEKVDKGVEFRVKFEEKVVVNGKVSKLSETSQSQKILDPEKIKLSIMENSYTTIASTELYKDLDKMGFSYGKCFRIMEKCICGETGGLVHFRIPDEVFKDVGKTTMHPCILDAMLQSTLIAIDKKTKNLLSKEGIILLPVAIESISLHRRIEEKHLLAYTVRSKTSIIENMVKVHYNSVLMNTDGTVIAEIRNFTTFSRRGSSFIPDELRYRWSWCKLQQISENMVMGKQNLLSNMIIDLTNNPETKRCFVGSQMNVCTLNEIHTTEKSFCEWYDGCLKSKTRTTDKPDIIIVLFPENSGSSITPSSRYEVYKSSVQNVMILVWLLKLIKTQKDTHIFITTQNTQNLPINEREEHINNLEACEAWGFIRSIQIEFVHSKITMVDIQPSLPEALETYLELVRYITSSNDNTRTEYVIHKQNVFGATFKKTAMTDEMPMSRISSIGRDETNYDILSSNHSCSENLYLTQSSNDGMKMTEKDCVCLKVKTLFKHSPEYLPATTSSDFILPNAWEHDGHGHNILGLEYTGNEIQKKSRKFYKCNRVDSIGNDFGMEWGTVAVYPTKMKTIVNVPKSCTINLRELPFYYHGLLSESILFLEILKHIPHGSSVRILRADTKGQWHIPILECMLKKLKAAKIQNAENANVDVVVLIGRASCKTLRVLQDCKTIVCCKKCIPEDIENLLTKRSNKKILEIDMRVLFSEGTLKTSLKQVISWLKKNADTIKATHSKDTSSCVSISSQMQTYLPIRKHINCLFNKDDIVISTGGLTGLGWQLTLLLAEMGVGHIATISRRKVDPETTTKIEELQKTFGCNVICFQGDVCELDAVQNMVNDLNNNFGVGRIRGVLHGAGVLDSKLLINMDQSHLERVMKPKIMGVMNLHLATKLETLEFFIVHSSITSYLGSPGQGNYGAANNFLDSFTRWRRQNGLPAQSINWGALGVGMASRKEFVDNFEKRGHLLLSITEIRNCFIHALLQDSTEVVFANLDLPTFSKDYYVPEMVRILPVMEQLFAGKNIKSNKTTSVQKVKFDLIELNQATSVVQQKAIEDLVTSTAKRVIGGDVGLLTLSSTFEQLGMDSMSAVTFSNILFQETNVRIKQEVFLDFEKTIKNVVDMLGKELFGGKWNSSNTLEMITETSRL